MYPNPPEVSRTFSEGKMSRCGVLKVFGGNKSVSGLMFPIGVLNFRVPNLRGEKTPLSISGGATECLRGENGDDRFMLGGVFPRLGVTKLKSGERERESISTSGNRFFTGVRKEELSKPRLLSCSFEFGVLPFELELFSCLAVLVSSCCCITRFECHSCKGLWTEMLEFFLRLGVGGASKLDSGSEPSDTHCTDWVSG